MMMMQCSFVGRCSNNGHAEATNVTLNDRVSSKCNCKARFALCSLSGAIAFSNEHAVECKPLTKVELSNNPNVYRCAQSPDTGGKLVQIGTELFTGDYALKSRHVQRQVENHIKKKFEGKNEPYVQPPVAYMKDIMRQAKNNMNDNIIPAESFSALVEKLDSDDMIQYSILHDVDGNGVSTVNAVAFHDKSLAPRNLTPSTIWTADVTFGLTEDGSGISRWICLFECSDALPPNVS
jgi:hypothetical protein